MTQSIVLVKPDLNRLQDYVDVLKRGWSPDNMRGKVAADEQLERIAHDPVAFVTGLDDPEGKGPPLKLLDGSTAQRLPGFHRWIWDGEFCGGISFRWQRGTSTLPPHVPGHIGYAVVPWKQRRGFATEAVRHLLPDCRARGLTYVELTTDTDNIPSQRVIASNGGVLVERFVKPPAQGGKEALRWRINL